MSKFDLKSLLASMGTGEIHQLLAELKRYASTSATVDSLKRVFETGHLLEFQLENGDHILVDEFIESEPVAEDEVRVVFGVFGVIDDIKLAICFNTANGWVLNKSNPIYCFDDIAPTALVFDDDTSSGGMGAVSVAVCKFQRGVYDEPCDTSIERETASLMEKIATEVKKDEIKEDEFIIIDDKLTNIFAKMAQWLNQGNRRVILDVSRSFTFEDEYRSSRTSNNFSLAFKCLEVDCAKRVAKFGDCTSNKNDFSIKADDFINGCIEWDARRKNLAIANEDKTYVIRISFMEGAKVVDIDDETMRDIAPLIK